MTTKGFIHSFIVACCVGLLAWFCFTASHTTTLLQSSVSIATERCLGFGNIFSPITTSQEVYSILRSNVLLEWARYRSGISEQTSSGGTKSVVYRSDTGDLFADNADNLGNGSNDALQGASPVDEIFIRDGYIGQFIDSKDGSLHIIVGMYDSLTGEVSVYTEGEFTNTTVTTAQMSEQEYEYLQDIVSVFSEVSLSHIPDGVVLEQYFTTDCADMLLQTIKSGALPSGWGLTGNTLVSVGSSAIGGAYDRVYVGLECVDSLGAHVLVQYELKLDNTMTIYDIDFLT